MKAAGRQPANGKGVDMKQRTLAIAASFGRVSCWALGLGLLAIGIGEALAVVSCCRQSELEP